MNSGKGMNMVHEERHRFLAPNRPSPSSFLADAWANRDLGLTLGDDQHCYN